ncbi:g1261 [Coccomyxa viridis]|uniref:G1261 protein n=1 Tax=Coccomyxa viridis TaxID=1274662 RepID=A0ABP1FPF9_9CHLO
MGRLPRPLSAGSLQRLDIAASSKPPAGPSHLSNRSTRQVQARAAAALYSSPQQPCLVHGCPVRGHLDLDASSVGEVNHRIKLSAQWSDVAKVVTEMGERLHPSNIAYALYRLGCMFCFLSSQRKAALEQSGTLGQLVAMATKHVASFGSSELTFVLDGMARLRVQAPSAFMNALAKQAAALAQDLEADQLPLVYWAFATLGYCPTAAALAALDARATCIASQLSAQGITLVLSACCQLPHQPSEGLLEALAAAMGRSLSAFKRQELASCLDAFKALGFHPGNELIQDIARVAGIQVPEGALKSEPALANNVIPGRPKTPGKQGALQRARQMASTSAEQLLTASSTPGASLVKGQSVIRARAQDAVCSKPSLARHQPMPEASVSVPRIRGGSRTPSPQQTGSQDPCSYWRFRGKQDFIRHVQTHR